MKSRLTDMASRRGGFTLLEVLIAIFILSLVMSTVYVSYTGTLKVSRQVEEEGNIYKMARITMDRLIRDLSSLQPSGGTFYFTAEKEKIKNNEFHSLYFWSAAHLALEENEGQGSPAVIRYMVQEEGNEGGFSLWRADAAIAKPAQKKETADGYVICRHIEAFKLTFYDAQERETDVWDSGATASQGEPLPRSAKIELALTNPGNREKPYTFMTRVFLPSKKRTP